MEDREQRLNTWFHIIVGILVGGIETAAQARRARDMAAYEAAIKALADELNNRLRPLLPREYLEVLRDLRQALLRGDNNE